MSQFNRTLFVLVLLVGGLLVGGCSSEQNNDGQGIGKHLGQSTGQDTLRKANTMHPDAATDTVAATHFAPIVFTPAQVILLKQGLAIAGECIRDTVFANVLREQAKANNIAWGKERLSAITNASHRAAPTEYLLSQYAERGLTQFNHFVAVKWADKDKTSSVAACAETTYINVNALARSASSIAGTLVHERAHSFCQKHNENDVTKNECDFAYQAGDLAYLLGLYRANNSQPIKKPPLLMCDNLINKLRKRKIVK